MMPIVKLAGAAALLAACHAFAFIALELHTVGGACGALAAVFAITALVAWTAAPAPEELYELHEHVDSRE